MTIWLASRRNALGGEGVESKWIEPGWLRLALGFSGAFDSLDAREFPAPERQAGPPRPPTLSGAPPLSGAGWNAPRNDCGSHQNPFGQVGGFEGLHGLIE